MKTPIDIAKSKADYRIVDVSRKGYGLRDKYQKYNLVNKKELKRIQKRFKVVPDF
jgi:hypothetical protein